jgi:hypothetical protein
MADTVKEVLMDVPQEGGARASRKRRAGRGARKTRVAEGDDTIVTKDGTQDVAHAAPAAPAVSTDAKPAPKVILAPAKKKPAKVMLVPKGKTTVRTVPRKTFRAKRVKVVIDNTAKTQKHRKAVLEKVDAMSEDQIRAAAVQTRLSRREAVGNAPIGLLRQMLKDYQTMRGMLL